MRKRKTRMTQRRCGGGLVVGRRVTTAARAAAAGAAAAEAEAFGPVETTCESWRVVGFGLAARGGKSTVE
ncbi:hypothetical protein PR202_gb00394 [Eleusine coracana subsp. coracana]|uniref:Secreted protein n=1 Tax=Eleusine coracana subsp. coracana TaxID=191504 RepID=A0AAV5DRF8_ELECO|nr:hypothetical protein PR202_gb00394 [Eleusine coracana subsp. coracana]